MLWTDRYDGGGSLKWFPCTTRVECSNTLSLALGDWKFGGTTITVIGMMAGLNGALVQIVMASRVAYGLAGQGQAPSVFRRIHGTTRTPLEATAAVTCLVLALALWLPLELLAKVTSTILLAVYGLVNLSLWRIKSRNQPPPQDAPCYPRWLSLVATIVCASFLLFHLISLVFLQRG